MIPSKKEDVNQKYNWKLSQRKVIRNTALLKDDEKLYKQFTRVSGVDTMTLNAFWAILANMTSAQRVGIIMRLPHIKGENTLKQYMEKMIDEQTPHTVLEERTPTL